MIQRRHQGVVFGYFVDEWSVFIRGMCFMFACHADVIPFFDPTTRLPCWVIVFIGSMKFWHSVRKLSSYYSRAWRHGVERLTYLSDAFFDPVSPWRIIRKRRCWWQLPDWSCDDSTVHLATGILSRCSTTNRYNLTIGGVGTVSFLCCYLPAVLQPLLHSIMLHTLCFNGYQHRKSRA